MSSDNAFGVEPPKDADGKVIPLDTEVLYSQCGKVFEVEGFRYSLKIKEWFAYGRYSGAERNGCGETNRYLLAPPDSWDKLIEDLRKAADNPEHSADCGYLDPKNKGCEKCPANDRYCLEYAFTDIADRIEDLRKSDEG